MPSITEERANNVTRATELGLQLYDLKTEEEKRNLYRDYVHHIAKEYSVTLQREFIQNLERLVKRYQVEEK